MALVGGSIGGSSLASSSSSFFQGRSSFFQRRSSRSLSFVGKTHVGKHFVVLSRKLSGLEEAMRIRRSRELQSKVRKRPPLRRGKVSSRLPVPEHILRPPYVGTSQLPEISSEHQVHDDEGVTQMKAACELAARVLDFAGSLVRVSAISYNWQPSVTTDEIDKAVHQMIIDAGAYPSPLGYGGFPKSVCTSVNECMCHGIPDSRQLQDGDIINIDVTVYLNGYHGDTSRTYLCGNVDEAAKRLVKVTEECLEKAISVCKDGASFKKIGKKISDHAERYGYGVVERFVGHGVGRVFHSEPIILHHRNDGPGFMVEGETFTIVVVDGWACIVQHLVGHDTDKCRTLPTSVQLKQVKLEPILTLGSIDCITWEDGWTAVTADGSLAAQFEHSLLITKTGAEILTKF